MATTTYCVRADIDAVLSLVGVDRTVDDDESGSLDGTETGYITRAIEWGAHQINMRILTLVGATNLGSSDYARDANAVFAAYFLSKRKRNSVPGSLVSWYDQIIAELDDIRAGRLDLPEVNPEISRFPSVSNYSVRLGREPPVLVDTGRSTKPSPSGGVKRPTL